METFDAYFLEANGSIDLDEGDAQDEDEEEDAKKNEVEEMEVECDDERKDKGEVKARPAHILNKWTRRLWKGIRSWRDKYAFP